MISLAAVMSKPVSRGEPWARPPRPGDHLAQVAVVHVEAAAPRDRERVEADLVPVVEVRVDQRGEQVVGGRDRVQVTGEVEVQILHRDDLRVAAAGRAALYAEDRAERRLAQAEDRLPPDRAEALGERNRVVVFPSPAGVGVIAVTLISFASGRSASRSMTERSTFAL